jgi:uncharacterized protein
MPAYLHPGVYVEEIPSGAKPIEGVATSVAAFIGAAKKGPAGEAVLIHGWDDYVRGFGPIYSTSDTMGLAVSAFYLNGGRDAYIVRLVSTSAPAKAAYETIAGEGAGADAVLKIEASSVGDWGNEIYFKIKKTDSTSLTFTLEAGHLENAEFTADEVITGLGMDAEDDNFALTRVNGVSALVKLSLAANADPDNAANVYQQGSLTGAAMDSGDTVFSAGMADEMTMSLNIDGLGVKKVKLGTAASLGLAGDNAADGKKVADAVAAAVQACGPQKSYASFACGYGADCKFTLTSGTKSSHSSVKVYDGDGKATDLAHFLKLDSSAKPASVYGFSKVVPKAVAGPSGQGKQLGSGSEGAPTETEFKDFFSGTLKKIKDVSIIVLPGQYMAADGSGNAVISAALAHAEDTRSRMVILDPPPSTELSQAATVDQMGLSTSTYGVLYYPWVKVANPLYNPDLTPTADKTVTIAPSAFAAGMWSKTDGRRGVWKAPAGVESALLGVSGLTYTVGDGDQDQLNPLGVNCLRKLPGYGPVIWGTRTLATKADPEWRYVPIRRTAIMIEQSVYNGIQWAVFEPNNHHLWASLRANIGAFMDGLFRAGAFQGEKASDAYFVRCGLGDTMTQDDIDRGQVIVIVGFAPLKPAEFVIVRIQQKVAQQ